jgi:hypothetical protein
MTNKKNQMRDFEKKTQLSRHEREQLRSWVKSTPSQRLAWLEEAMRLAAKTKIAK